jgi:Ankyrin repeats (many copies)/Ankyrin repeats (3 copies)
MSRRLSLPAQVPYASLARSRSRENQTVDEQLYAAAKDNDLPALKLLIAQEPPPNLDSDLGSLEFRRTALHVACVEGHFDIVSFLLEKGASPDSRDPENKTPLWLAARSSQWDIVKFLLKTVQDPEARKMYVNLTDNHQSTAFHAAVQSVQPISEWDSEVAQIFINAGADVDLQDDQGCTAAHYACHKKSYSVVRLFTTMYKKDCTWINRPAGVEFMSQTCLHMSAAKGRADDIDWLLKKMDQQSVKLKDGSEQKRTAWEIACCNRDAAWRLNAMGAFMFMSFHHVPYSVFKWDPINLGEICLEISSVRMVSEQTREIIH